MKVSLSNRVWNLFISPRDRTLKDEVSLYANVNKVGLKLYEVPNGNKSSSYCAKYYLAQNSVNRNVPNEERKLLVVFPGRNFNFFQIGNTFYTQKLFKTSKLDEFDIATIIYPAKTRNLEELSNSCELAIEQLLSSIHGYTLSNVSIIGWCLGGYFATETMRRFVELNQSFNDTFQCFINNKSFSSIHEFLYFILPKYIRPLLKFWPIKRYVRKWNSDSSRSLEAFDDAFKNIYVVYSDSDPIVNGLAHFYKHVDDRHENIEIREDVTKSDHFCNWNLLAEILENATKSTDSTSTVSSKT